MCSAQARALVDVQSRARGQAKAVILRAVNQCLLWYISPISFKLRCRVVSPLKRDSAPTDVVLRRNFTDSWKDVHDHKTNNVPF